MHWICWETILGEGRTSRLYKAMKMDANVVYDFSAGAYAMADPGLFFVDATLHPQNLEQALEMIGREISQMAEAPVLPEELEKAKTKAEASFVFSMEDMSGQARTMGYFQTMTGDMDNADHYLSHIQKVTALDIQRVCKIYLKPENLSMAILAPESAKMPLEDLNIGKFFKKPAAEALEKEKPSKAENAAKKMVLSNGMRIVLKENHRLPEVSFTAAMMGGKRLEKDGEWGISAFVSDMLIRGTTRRSAAEIASSVESWAGSLEGFSGRNSLGVSGKFLSKDLYGALDLLADVVLHADFPASEMKKVRTDILAAIKAKKDRPTGQLFELFYKTLYEQHPYGHPATGTEETITALTREDLKEWYDAVRVPENFVLSVVGDFKQEQLMPYLETLFEPFQKSFEPIPRPVPEPPLKKPRIAYLDRPGAQTHLAVGYLGAGLKSPLNPSMALVDTAMSGMGGRLFIKLRDRQSLAYAITAFRSPGLETGAFGVYLACDPEKLETARQAVFEEMDLLRNQGLSEEELSAAKRYLVGNLKIGMQTNGSQAMQMALDELYGLGYDHMTCYIEEINAVTVENVKEAADKIILPDGYVAVTVGPSTD